MRGKERLEITFFFAIFHRSFGAFIIGASSAFGLASGGDFRDDGIEGIGVGLDGAGASGITDGAEADGAS